MEVIPSRGSCLQNFRGEAQVLRFAPLAEPPVDLFQYASSGGALTQSHQNAGPGPSFFPLAA
jgi:hypothetical protein